MHGGPEGYKPQVNGSGEIWILLKWLGCLRSTHQKFKLHVTILTQLVTIEQAAGCWRQREPSKASTGPDVEHNEPFCVEEFILGSPTVVLLLFSFCLFFETLNSISCCLRSPTMERFRNLLGGGGMSIGGAAHGTVSVASRPTLRATDNQRPAKLLSLQDNTSLIDNSETVYISSLALLKMLRHGRAGVPMEVMGLMLGEFVDDFTVKVMDVFAMPQSGTGVSVEAVDPVFQTKMMDMLRQTGR